MKTFKEFLSESTDRFSIALNTEFGKVKTQRKVNTTIYHLSGKYSDYRISRSSDESETILYKGDDEVLFIPNSKDVGKTIEKISDKL